MLSTDFSSPTIQAFGETGAPGHHEPAGEFTLCAVDSAALLDNASSALALLCGYHRNYGGIYGISIDPFQGNNRHQAIYDLDLYSVKGSISKRNSNNSAFSPALPDRSIAKARLPHRWANGLDLRSESRVGEL
jgi:hypothetical protein